MSDVEARALGAGDTITVPGKDRPRELRVSPVGLRELKEIQRAAVRYYRRSLLDTYREEIETLGRDWYEKKVEEVSRIDIDSLPRKKTLHVASIDINDKVQRRLEGIFGELPPEYTGKLALLSVALNSGDIKPEDIQADTGKLPRKYAVAYDSWWVTNVYDGMAELTYAGLRKHNSDITREEIEEWGLEKIAEAAHLIDTLTTPDMGNT